MKKFVLLVVMVCLTAMTASAQKFALVDMEYILKKGGFILAHWDGTPETEQQIKEETKATIRCIPLPELKEFQSEPGVCMVTGKPSAGRVVFALSY